MSFSAEKDNNPDKWNKLLSIVEEKLQLRLLAALERISSYHFEEDILYIESSCEEDVDYFFQPLLIHHLEVLVNELLGIKKIEIRKAK